LVKTVARNPRTLIINESKRTGTYWGQVAAALTVAICAAVALFSPDSRPWSPSRVPPSPTSPYAGADIPGSPLDRARYARPASAGVSELPRPPTPTATPVPDDGGQELFEMGLGLEVTANGKFYAALELC